jgi:hypothetical protein
MKNYFLLAIITMYFSCVCSNTYSQDTISEITIIKKKVFVVEEKNHNFYIFLGSSFSINKDYYRVCPNNDCITYLEEVRNSTKNLWNNSYSGGLAFSPGKFYSELSLSYSNYRERFIFYDNNTGTSINRINRYEYLDAGILLGYRINKWWTKASFKKRNWRKKTSYILLGGIIWNKKKSITGQTLSKKQPGNVIPLSDMIEFYENNYRMEVGGRFMYKLKSNFYLMTGLFYSYDLRSIIKTSELYVRQRNIVGVNLSLMYNL